MATSNPLTTLALDALPDGWESIGVVALIKCRDEDGEETWAFRTSEQLSEEETLGALVVRTELLKEWLLSQYKPAGDDDV